MGNLLRQEIEKIATAVATATKLYNRGKDVVDAVSSAKSSAQRDVQKAETKKRVLSLGIRRSSTSDLKKKVKDGTIRNIKDHPAVQNAARDAAMAAGRKLKKTYFPNQ